MKQQQKPWHTIINYHRDKYQPLYGYRQPRAQYDLMQECGLLVIFIWRQSEFVAVDKLIQKDKKINVLIGINWLH